MNQKILFANGKKKIKMKKNALDPVDFEEEKRKDPKYKTELCKSFLENGFCVYGNKCRFAHGKNELMTKSSGTNYKKKPCKSFIETGFCPYGSRCNFKHDERSLEEIVLPYYFVNTFIKNTIPPGKRLKIFEEITEHNCERSSISTEENDSESSTEDNSYFTNVSYLNIKGCAFNKFDPRNQPFVRPPFVPYIIM